MKTGISVKLTPELQKNLTDFTKENNLSMKWGRIHWQMT